jgi:uncharacterized protein YggE
LSTVNILMAKLIEGLKALGIAAKDIETTAITIVPRYATTKDVLPLSPAIGSSTGRI